MTATQRRCRAAAERVSQIIDALEAHMDGVPDETQEEAGAWVARYTEAATRLGLVAAQKERRAAEEALLDAAEAMTRGLGSAEALHGFLAARTHQNLRYRRELLALAMRAPLRA